MCVYDVILINGVPTAVGIDENYDYVEIPAEMLEYIDTSCFRSEEIA